MDKMTLVLMAVAVALVLMAGVQAIQLSELKASGTTGAVTAGGAADMSGWTEDEKMMYEHHGTLPARLSAQSASAPKPASSGMVGGC